VADENEVPEVTLVNTHKTFAKRPIEQLDIIKEIDVLVSLSGKAIYTLLPDSVIHSFSFLAL
jgi:hypothetical protein